MKIRLILLLLLLPMMAFAGEVDNAYVIDRWLYQAQVHEDNTWTVTEVLDVTFREERHGIYRYIPQTFVRKRSDGAYTYFAKVCDVKVSESFAEEDNDDKQDNHVIIIGNEDVLVSGRHTYTINYTLRYPDDRYVLSDELVHTVLGADCNTTIGRFEYRITFDKPLPKNFAQELKTYSGEWGGDGNELNVRSVVDEKTICGVINNVPPFKAVTIAGELPINYWKGAYSLSTILTYVFYCIFGVLFAYVLARLLLRSRRRPTVSYEYSAPKGISSAQVGVIIDDSADLSDLTSLVVWFASKGYLKITETQKDNKGKDTEITLTKLKELDKDAPKYQKKFWKVLFGEGKKANDSVALSKLGDRHEQIAQAMFALSAHFKGERKLTSVNWKLFGMWLLCILAGAGAIMLSSSVSRLGYLECIFGITLWAIPLFLATVLRIFLSNEDMIRKRSWLVKQFVAWAIAVAVECVIMFFMFNNPHDQIVDVELMSLVMISGWVIVLLSGRFKSDSLYRKEKMSSLLGFRDFIEKSELPMLKALVDENPAYFYDVLPYAMVFGLTDKWVKQFEKIDIQRPDWYETDLLPQDVAAMSMVNHLVGNTSKSMMSLIEVSSHDPSADSGSGGNGHSAVSVVGGGGGGGGVGSW